MKQVVVLHKYFYNVVLQLGSLVFIGFCCCCCYCDSSAVRGHRTGSNKSGSTAVLQQQYESAVSTPSMEYGIRQAVSMAGAKFLKI